MAGRASQRKSRAGKKKPVSAHSRCDLIFSVARMTAKFREGRYSIRCGAGAGVFAAAVMQFLTEEIFLLAGDAAAAGKKKRILPRHIMLAIRNDEELSKLLAEAMIVEAGVPSNIHGALFKKGKLAQAAITEPAE